MKARTKRASSLNDKTWICSQSHAVDLVAITESFNIILVKVIMTFLPCNCWYYSPKNKSLSNFIFHYMYYIYNLLRLLDLNLSLKR